MSLSKPISTKKKTIFSLIAISFGILAACIIIEITARVILYRQGEFIDTLKSERSTSWGGELSLFDIITVSGNPNQVYKMIPKAEGSFAGVPLKLNSFGFRDKEWVVSKPEDTFRIAVLGDSVAFGWGINEGDRFSNQIEIDLNSSSPLTGKKFEVMNFAVPGYNTVMEAATLHDQILQFKPDLIFVALVDNDAELPGFVRRQSQALAINRSFIFEAIRDQINGLKFADTARRVKGGVAQDVIAQLGDSPGSKSNTSNEFSPLLGTDKLKSALLQINQEKIPVICLAYENLRDENGKIIVTTNPFARISKELGIPVFTATKEILSDLIAKQKPAVSTWVSANDFHPNAATHKIIASKSTQEIISQLLSD